MMQSWHPSHTLVEMFSLTKNDSNPDFHNDFDTRMHMLCFILFYLFIFFFENVFK